MSMYALSASCRSSMETLSSTLARDLLPVPAQYYGDTAKDTPDGNPTEARHSGKTYPGGCRTTFLSRMERLLLRAVSMATRLPARTLSFPCPSAQQCRISVTWHRVLMRLPKVPICTESSCLSITVATSWPCSSPCMGTQLNHHLTDSTLLILHGTGNLKRKRQTR